MKKTILTLFHGRSCDRNNLAFLGAHSVACEISDMLDIPVITIGTPEQPLNSSWEYELAEAKPSLVTMAEHYDSILLADSLPITIMPRCAVGLSTLPIVAKYRPDACLVWLDAHADLNTPKGSDTGYLGGMVISGAAGLWDSGLGKGLELNNVVLLGTRDIDTFEKKLIKTKNISVLPPQVNLAAELEEKIAGRPAYVHIDCDVLDNGLVPTEYQVPGGLSFAELREISEVIAKGEVVGLEIAEYQHELLSDGIVPNPFNLIGALKPLISK